MVAFVEEFEARPYEETVTGHRVANAMLNFFAENWFPRPLHPFARDLTRYLAGERVCRLHGIGWPGPLRTRLVRVFLKTVFRLQGLLPDPRTPLTARLKKSRLSNGQLKTMEPYAPAVGRAEAAGRDTAAGPSA